VLQNIKETLGVNDGQKRYRIGLTLIDHMDYGAHQGGLKSLHTGALDKPNSRANWYGWEVGSFSMVYGWLE
jgi:hypothetical protein